MTRKKRADSTAEQVKAMQAPAVQPPATVPLDKKQLPFFLSVIDMRARSEWTTHDVEYAALLARDMASLETEAKLLADEGVVVAGAGGGPVQNPRATYMNSLRGSIAAARRSLALHARARANGDTRSVARRNEVLKEAQDGVGDDLLARPN